jgi:hypothetical protein
VVSYSITLSAVANSVSRRETIAPRARFCPNQRNRSPLFKVE